MPPGAARARRPGVCTHRVLAWWAHETIARKAGLADAVMADLRECRRPASIRRDERLVYDYCVQLTLNHRVPDPRGRGLSWR